MVPSLQEKYSRHHVIGWLVIKKRDKIHKEEASFILNGGASVQGKGRKNYHTE